MVHWPAASASPESLLENVKCQAPARPTKSQSAFLTRAPGDSCAQNWETFDPEYF